MANRPDLRPVLAATTPEEAVAFFRQKGYRISWDYRDVWRQEHQAAFTVAKVMQLDLLQDIRQAVDQALAQGTTFADFKEQLVPLLQAKGWWGRVPSGPANPDTGELPTVQLGSVRRLATIFDTNLATAYSEGQWQRVQETKRIFPFLLYDGRNSEKPRAEHLPWDGLVLPADDPWWQSHMPVRAWGCKCGVISMTREMVEAEGLQVASAAPVERLRDVPNKRTGQVERVPVGVDPAFNYPPGGRRAHLEKLLNDRLNQSGGAGAQP